MASFDTNDPSVWLMGFGALGLTTRAILFGIDLVRRSGKVRCVATLVDHEPYQSNVNDGPSTYYHQIFEVQAPDGSKPRVTLRSVGYPEPGPIDGSVKRDVWLDPKDPDKSFVDPFTNQKNLATIMPVLFFAAGVALWFFRQHST